MLRIRLIPWWGWLLGGVAMCSIALLMFRSAMTKAEARGYDRAMIEAAQAAADASAAYRAQVEDAERAQSKREAARRARLSPIKQKADTYARTAADCPDTAGRLLINEAIRASDNPAPAAKG